MLVFVMIFTGVFAFSINVEAQPATGAASSLARNITRQPTPAVFGAAGDVNISGHIPNVRVPGNPGFQAGLNEHFADQFHSFVQAHANTAISMNFSFEVYTSGPYVSVVMEMVARSASVTRGIATTVIHASRSELVELPDIHPNSVRVVNNYIESMISANPRGFISNFPGISDRNNFYLDGDYLVLPFGSVELIPNDRNITTIRLYLPNIQDEIITKDYFFTLPPSQYSTIMVQLRAVTRDFGFRLLWSESADRINIMQGQRYITSITIGTNSYVVHGRPARELESAPMIVDNRTYVPLSFFDEILGIATLVNNGYIIFSMYNDNGN